MSLIMNNVVRKEKMRDIQLKVLEEISEILTNSFGPNGSNTCIKKENAFSRYTKDGHTIIGALHYNGIIEQSIKDDVESITRHIVKTVGDGTTSAVILSNYIFKCITQIENEGTFYPADIISTLEKICADMKNKILSSAKELTLKDVYDIAMISTNGNEFISNTLKEIYEEYGNGVFIDVSVSMGEEVAIKNYNGMTLNTGYADSCYVTNKESNTAEVDKPDVYFFEHPIDTPELGVFLDSILSHNIIEPVNTGNYDSLKPTVIFAPKISQDMSSVMDSLTASMAQMPTNNKLPICIVTDYHEKEQLMDLAKMCGAKMIRKYIDAKIYANDVERGAAPTRDTVFEWGGKCDKVISYSDKTVFVRPSKMYNEDGEYSELYKNMLDFLETEISKSTENADDARTVGTLKRRLNSLKANMVELFVGGITQADRDALRDLVEDAVLNIRSAAQNGVGLGANMLATGVSYDIWKGFLSDEDVIDIEISDNLKDPLYTKVADAIGNAYAELNEALYRDSDCDIELFERLEEADRGLVYNIRERKMTDNVKASIMSDIIILETVCKIIGIMATCNQFLVPTAMHNIYTDTTKAMAAK